ncbi:MULTISPECIES: hypothetical protein [unclassified Meridianimarinicoccus]|uniref:hypothetical protein n=1 Tax=unclassified Meridianimarinicoccus TaxID=2923344 RepID=UPI001866DA1A|nr:hypothetical protein [Fluviibacterium sp. MJW13]
MRAVGFGTVLAVLAGISAAHAQNAEFDAALSHAAREEVTQPGDSDKSDNDISRLAMALSWDAGGDGRMRAALELGVGNEDFDGPYPALNGFELAFGRRVGMQRYAAGARIRSDDDFSTTTELAYSAEHFGRSIDWHGLFGMQFVADSDDVPGRDGPGLFGQVDGDFYINDNWLLMAGALADTDGAVYGFGTEYRFDGAPISLFLDYAEAFNDYRGQQKYDSLSVGIRIMPKSKSLRSFHQSNLSRAMFRLVEVQ